MENICRVQFNDYRLRSLSLKDLSAIEVAYFSLHPEKQASDIVYYIFDGIHRIEGWEDYILHLLANYRKVYSIDWALAGAIAPGSGIDITRKFKNMIFLELKRRGYQPYYFRTKEGYEIDFVILPANKNKSILIQVCYSLEMAEYLSFVRLHIFSLSTNRSKTKHFMLPSVSYIRYHAANFNYIKTQWMYFFCC